MRQTPSYIPRNLTAGWRCPERLANGWGRAAIVALLLGTATARAEEPAPLGPAAPASTAELDRLRFELQRQIDQLAQSRQLELNQMARALAEERAARAAERAQGLAELDELRRSFDESKVVRAGRFGLSLTGFLQADAVAWRQSSADQLNPTTGDLLNQSRFLIRRARLRVDMDYGIVAGALEFDGNTVNGTQARLIGAEASLRWRAANPAAPPYLMLTIGLFKTPFGFEVGQSDRDRLFLERSNVIRALFPGEYDLGARLQGGWRFLRYSIAAMNGDPLGEKQFPGRDPNESKDFMGRIGVDTRVTGAVSFAGGFSGLYGTGFHKGDLGSKDTLVWRDTNENGLVDAGELQTIPGKQPLPSQNFNRYAVGGDVRLTVRLPRVGELLVYGELVYATNLDRSLVPADPIGAGRDLRELGYYVGATQELTRFGMIGIRYDSYNPDQDANDRQGGKLVLNNPSYSTLALAAALRYPPYGRLVFEYDHNGNALGRDSRGVPTTLADDAFTIRGEVTF